MAPSESTATRQNSIVDARNEVATANGRASFAHATALVAEIRLRDAKIESLERSNQELITLRDRYACTTCAVWVIGDMVRLLAVCWP